MNEARPHILVVDDELSMREFLELLLSKAGYAVSCAENGRKAVALLEDAAYDLILCDIRLGDISGLDVLRKAKMIRPQAIVIMISAYATAENAVEAMNEGAFDYLPKPFDTGELKQTIAKALNLRTLSDEKRSLDDETRKNLHFGLLVGNSPRMEYIYDIVEQVAKTRTNVLITGESGTGKELIARAIHQKSSRSDKPFVVVNCGSIPEMLMESEFFGHRRGAFTGANQDRKGLLDSAHTGTVFLDEIGELSGPMQVKLLRVVQERAFKPVGSNEDIFVDIRILAATNKKLEEEVIAGRFREDLFYRINVVEIKVPPLRDRKGDIKALAQYFLDKYSREAEKEITKISSYAVDLLQKYDFPGNIRELENLIERSVALSTTNIILPDSLSLSMHKRRWIEGIPERRFDLEDVAQGVSLDTIIEEIERAYIEKALESSGGNKHRAAELLGITLRSLRYRCSKLSIEKSFD